MLIRGVVVDGVEPVSTNGPGRLTRQLGIDLTFDGTVAELYDDGVPPPTSPTLTPRIGITKASEWHRRWLVPKA